MRGLLTGLAAAGLGLTVLTTQMKPSNTARQSWPGGSQPRDAHGPPERPRNTVDISEIVPTGRTIRVTASGNFQAALDEASPGDLITLEPGATYRGPFRLPRKEGVGWVVVSSGPSGGGLPPPGERVNLSHAVLMAKLVASTGSVIVAERAAHHYRFVGVEIAPVEGVFLRDLVLLGATETDLEALPHHIIFDRCYLHGDRQRGGRRGVAMNSRDTAIVNSHLSDFKEVGADSQAIAGWNGAGPFKIANNYLEAAGENVMFGGADPSIPGLVPADIEVLGNHMTKPLSWKIGDGRFEGVAWTVKNLFELKNARRVLIDGNLFEYNWPQAQNGFAILFTVRNQDGRAPWSVVEDIIFQNNVVRHVAGGINVLGRDDNHPSQQSRRIAIRNNVFLDIGGRWGGGRLFQLLNGTSDISIEHNTTFQTDSIIWGGDQTPHTGFVFQNNVVLHNLYGIIASGTGMGRPTLDRYFPGGVVRRNVIVGGRPAQYPPDNFFPASVEQVSFAGLQGGDYRLAGSSRYKHAGSDDRDPGADVEGILQGLAPSNRISSATVRELPR